MKLSAGDFLCLEGDFASSLYIVISGTLSGTGSAQTAATPRLFEPGDIIDVFSLLEHAPREYTLKAEEDCEIQVVEHEQLKAILDEKPSWLRSIIEFLIRRNHIGEENARKSNLVQALPSLLYLLSGILKEQGGNTAPMATVSARAARMNGTRPEECRKLFKVLQELGVLRIQEDLLQVQSPELVHLLYETLRYRALEQKISPNILSMTDQMVLTVFIRLSQRSKDPLRNGLSAISTADLKKESKKSMHGMTLTTRTIGALVEKGILTPSTSLDFHQPLNQAEFFFGDFDRIMDLLELNRIFPLLDKKLVE